MNAAPATTPMNAATSRAGGFMAERLRAKGWSIRDAAQYLGVSRQRLYTVFDDPGRARLWECAIAGMPVCTAQIKEELRASRKASAQAKPKHVAPPSEHPPEFEPGDKVIAIRSSGLADEDEEALIVSVRGTKKAGDLAILVQGPSGEDWLPEKDFHHYFSSTGLNTYRP
ncbi:hypothetical protein ACDW_45700 (plasmid) [Acidovorax sp. DW039]|uniref:helix-turn-helix domain-containing protein n=1 Tax=Acidovorax sp. DW039 TaxID=3095606 RepID=UPI0030937507|nr:hypothetical protein ACDW_45700 [Acidovorax sp. DW039]